MLSPDAAKAMEAFASAEKSGVATGQGMLSARNHIIICILLSNGCRAGVILAITHGHLANMRLDPESGVQTITVILFVTTPFVILG